jgi:hypothetical protein
MTTRLDMKPCIALAVFGALALDAAAQHAPAGATHPGNPAARPGVTNYQSPFRTYVPYREPALVPWRELNDEVARAGGHAGIFRPSAQSDAASAAPAPSGQGAIDSHRHPGGHAPAKLPEPPAAAPRKPAGAHAGH